MYNVEKSRRWMYNVENGGDGCTMLRIEGMDVQC